MHLVYKEHIEGLEILLHRAGNYTMPGMHYHDSFEIVILEDGDRSYMLEDQLIYLKPRDVLLIKRNELHCSVGGTYKSSNLTFEKKHLLKFLSEHGVDVLTKCFEKTVIRVREKDFGLLISLMERLYANKDDFFSLVGVLNILESNMTRKTYDLQNINHKVADIVDYITENYMSIDNLDAIADKFYISKQYLCNLFKEYTGTSVTKYINMLKIHASFELITQKELTLTEIAEKCGYSSLSYFSKQFKSITGVSPLNYMKNESKDEDKS